MIILLLFLCSCVYVFARRPGSFCFCNVFMYARYTRAIMFTIARCARAPLDSWALNILILDHSHNSLVFLCSFLLMPCIPLNQGTVGLQSRTRLTPLLFPGLVQALCCPFAMGLSATSPHSSSKPMSKPLLKSYVLSYFVLRDLIKILPNSKLPLISLFSTDFVRDPRVFPHVLPEPMSSSTFS